MAFFVPPGGFAGFAQMTPASKVALTKGTAGKARSRRGVGRSTGTKGYKSTGYRAKRTSRKGGGAYGLGRRHTRPLRKSGTGRLKFGSPAWQRKYKVGAFRKKRR